MSIDVLHVEGRILAHQHRIERRQGLGDGVVEAIPVVERAGEREAPRTGRYAPLAQRQFVLFTDMQRMTAGGGRLHHREARVLVGPEGGQRVENDQQAHGRRSSVQ
jgi:hypothetical protein